MTNKNSYHLLSVRAKLVTALIQREGNGSQHFWTQPGLSNSPSLLIVIFPRLLGLLAQQPHTPHLRSTVLQSRHSLPSKHSVPFLR